jgi:hypothetical protein
VESYLAKTGQSRHFYEIVGIGEALITSKHTIILLYVLNYNSDVDLYLTVALYALATYYTSVHGSLLASAALGLLTARLGFIMHCGNHMATSNYGWANTLAGYCMEIAGSSHIVC